MSSDYFISLENKNKCPKCKSYNIDRRFNNVEDTEDYHFHHDTLKCFDCGFWDFPSAFSNVEMESNKTEKCPKCGTIGEVKLYDYDFFSGDVEFLCKCGYKDNIENFVGKDRWERFLKEEAKKKEKEINDYAEYMSSLDWN